MLFIYPMWDNQSQRIGKQRCTPLGYTLHSIATQLGFIGLLLLFGTFIYLGFRGFTGSFNSSLYWLLTVPFGVGIIAQIMYLYSWNLAFKKGFEYDWDKREASWLENDTRITYNYALEKENSVKE